MRWGEPPMREERGRSQVLRQSTHQRGSKVWREAPDPQESIETLCERERGLTLILRTASPHTSEVSEPTMFLPASGARLSSAALALAFCLPPRSRSDAAPTGAAEAGAEAEEGL